MQSFYQKVAKIQKELKAPKNQRNKFGNYNYRNQEDILEAVKPLLGDLVLTISDEAVEVGGRVYIKATAKISDGEGSSLSNSALAREPSEQKGMSESQLSGTASSYARKYCLNGLFLIDDTKDADSDEYQGKTLPQAMREAKETGNPVEVTTPDQKMTQANPENKVADAPKKSGPWGAKKVTKPVEGGDLY